LKRMVRQLMNRWSVLCPALHGLKPDCTSCAFRKYNCLSLQTSSDQATVD